MSAQLHRLLLVESQFVLRRTIVSVARDLAQVEFHEASSIERARSVLAVEVCRGLVLDIHEGSRAMKLLSDLRCGMFVTPRNVPVIALAADISPDHALHLQEFGVNVVLRKPFKIGHLLNAIGV